MGAEEENQKRKTREESLGPGKKASILGGTGNKATEKLKKKKETKGSGESLRVSGQTKRERGALARMKRKQRKKQQPTGKWEELLPLESTSTAVIPCQKSTHCNVTFNFG